MRSRLITNFLLILQCLHFSQAFKLQEHIRRTTSLREKNNGFEDFMLQKDTSNRGAADLSEEMRVKIKSEIVSPFRRLRQFLLFGTGAAAGLGAFTAIPQLIIATTRENPTIPLEQALQNAGIDLAGVIAAGYFLFKDFSSEAKTIEKFTDREKKSTGQLTEKESSEQEQQLALLPIEIQISESNENVTKVVSVGDLQSKGGQHLILVAGKKSFVRDAVLSARVERSELFIKAQTIVVAVVLDDEQIDEVPDSKKKGFSSPTKTELMTASFFGKPAQLSVWLDYLSKETKEAERQGNQQATKEGLVIVAKKTGKIIRRGVGLPPWKALVDELEGVEEKSN